MNGSASYEYPDAAGYPDGMGFLDEGTAPLVDNLTAEVVRSIDRPSSDADRDIAVQRDDVRGLYTASSDGVEVATVRFTERDGRVVLVATTAIPEIRGRGVAADLVAFALDDIRERGRKVIVECTFVSAFIAENQEYAALLD